MLVKCQSAIPGKQYRTQKGVLVEISTGEEKDKYGQVLAKREPSTGRILVHRVNETNKDVDYKNAVPIEGDYALEDGLTEVESKKLHRLHPGRKPHADKTWRGWAFRNSDKPELILETVRRLNLYIKSTTNYFLIGWNGHTFCSVYRNGDVAFPKIFSSIHPKIRHVPNANFCEYRLCLKNLTDREFVVLCENFQARFSQKLTELQQHGEKENDATRTY